jgi:serine protease Do
MFENDERNSEFNENENIRKEDIEEDMFAEEDIVIPEANEDSSRTTNAEADECVSGISHKVDDMTSNTTETESNGFGDEKTAYTPKERVYSYSHMGDKQEERRKKAAGKKHNRSMKLYAKVLCCAILFGAVSGGMIMGSFAIGKNVIQSQVAVETTATKLSTASSDSSSDNKTQTSDGEYTVSQISSQCKSSVVAITNQSVSEVQTMFGVMQQESTGSGSGVIIGKNDTELLIVTNNHVIEDAESLTVCFNDSKDAVFDAKVKGADSENDLAVIAIDLSDISEDVLNSISIATVGDSTSLQVGDQVVAIGNALGFGQSVTSGIISALDREVTIDDTTATLLQTDAAINPGNSGGALFNMKGELIGINTAKYASEQIEGMGFAIPMETAQSIIEDLMNRETRDKLDSGYGFLNISGQDVSDDATQMYGIPQGAYVAEVVEGGAAANAGIQQGDIITGLDGMTITGISELKEQLQYYKAGEQVEIVVQRVSDGGYKEMTFTVTLDNASDQQTTTQSDQEETTVPNDEGAQTLPNFSDDTTNSNPFGNH